MSARRKFTNIDDYVGTFPSDVRAILQKVRETIHKAVPGAEETISYGMPTLTLNGKYLVYFAAYENHISVYPIPSDTALHEVLAPYKAGKGTLRFPYSGTIPYELIGEVAKASVQDNGERVGVRH
jgi:uncharacterized protein YdhG (YjbR/CyaY superfamily)